MTEYPWLSYSQVPGKVGGFCRYCVLFGRQTGDRGDQTVGVLVAKPLCKFKDSKEQLRRHHLSSYHSSMAQGGGCWHRREALFQSRTRSTASDVWRPNVAKKRSRTRLLPIAETVILCGRQELAFRGHRDEGPLDLSEQQPAGDVKESNFKALLRYRAFGDEELRKGITNAPKNL